MTANDYLKRMTCLTCDGSGLLPDKQAALSWNVTVCNKCNGYGFVLWNAGSKKTVAYDKDAAVASKFNIATSRIRRGKIA